MPLVVALSCTLAAGSVVELRGDTFRRALILGFQPNYATTLQPPFQGEDAAPELVREWRTFPVRVAILDDNELYNEATDKTIRAACERWVTATKSLPGGGVSFTYERGAAPTGAQIVVRLCRMANSNDYSGLTLPQEPRWQYIQLAALDRDGKPVSLKRLEMVAAHEIGHALGITGHSPDSGDVMSLKCVSAEVSQADVNTLRIAYGGNLGRCRKRAE